jgi:hypothetical protein
MPQDVVAPPVVALPPPQPKPPTQQEIVDAKKDLAEKMQPPPPIIALPPKETKPEPKPEPPKETKPEPKPPPTLPPPVVPKMVPTPLMVQTQHDFDVQTAQQDAKATALPGQNIASFSPGSNLSGFGSFNMGEGRPSFGQNIAQLAQNTQQWAGQIDSMSKSMPSNTKFNLLAAAQSTKGAILSDPDVQRAVQLQKWDIVDSFANVANTSVDASTPIQFGPPSAPLVVRH